MPPESPPPLIPGIKAWIPVAFLEVGMAVRTSLRIVVCTFVLWTSTIGDAPVTVIVSATVHVPGDLSWIACVGGVAHRLMRPGSSFALIK